MDSRGKEHLCLSGQQEGVREMQRQSVLIGVFDDSKKADTVVQQLHGLGIADKQIERMEKMVGWDVAHAIPHKRETPEEMKPDFSRLGLAEDEARRYEDAYEAGYSVVMVRDVRDENSRQQVEDVFRQHGTYNSAEEEREQPESTGAMVPGMRGEDSSDIDGVANDAGGEQARQIDEQTIEADVEHAQNILQQQYQARKERGMLD
jgi:hypothetical protein